MTILKFLRKPYLAAFLSISVLTTSFGQTGNFSKHNPIPVSSNDDVSKLYELHDYALKNNPSPENNINIYSNWLKQNGGSITIKDAKALNAVMNTNTIDENINLAIESGNYSSGEIDAFKNLQANIESKDKSMETFGQVIFQFKDDINKLDLSKEKTEFYKSYFSALDLLNTAYPDTYSYAKPKWTKACALATAALVIAFAGLATLEAGSGGLATAIVVGGWLVACAAWGDACG